jgi:hypothetical protein
VAFLLDDGKPQAERVALIGRHPNMAAALVWEMTSGLAPGKEEYRRIPWIWRVAIAAGKRNDAAPLRELLDVSLPKKGEILRDWQAVVLGGGVINGLGLDHGWPGPRVKELLGNDAGLGERWQTALAAAEKMADDEKVPTGTRYDALRMVALLGWEKAGPQLTRYLAKGTNAELQMGAVSGLVDVDAPEATRALVSALGHLTGQNRKLAQEGLLRSDARATALLDAVEKGDVKADAVEASVRQALAKHPVEALRQRAARLLAP